MEKIELLSITEHRDLLGYVEKRDAASISVAQLAAANSDVREESARAQGEALRASRANVALAAEVMELAAQVAANKAGRAGDARSQQDFARLEAELKRSRQRWRVLKGLTSGVVVGSGINWMEDEKLCALVLDPDNED
jgi:hypothetical protein